jgi:hypothetical protein
MNGVHGLKRCCFLFSRSACLRELLITEVLAMEVGGGDGERRRVLAVSKGSDTMGSERQHDELL